MRKLVTIVIFLLGLTILYFIDQWQMTRWRSEKKIELNATLNLYQTNLKNTITSRFNAIESLASLFVLHPKTTPTEFAEFAEFLLEINPPIRAIQFADSDTRVTYVYPPKGNEITIKKPMTLISDPKRSPFVKKAIKEKKGILQGPFQLRQGGTGVAVRFPIFKEEKLIGLSIGVYDIEVLASEALHNLNFTRFAFNLRDATGKKFWEYGKLSDDFLHKELNIAGASWVINASWVQLPHPPVISRILICFFGFSLLLTILAYFQIIWKQEQRLKKEVEERTTDLSTSNKNLLKEIAERKQIETALRASEMKFSKTFQRAPLLMTISTVDDGRYIDVNEAFERVTGFRRDIAIGSTSVELGYIKKEDREKLVHELTAKGRVNDIELKLTGADGNLLECMYSGELIEVDGEERLLSIASNITERKKIEESLRQAQKMESIGNLAGGIAHDFNNLLFPIMGMSEMLLEDLPQGTLVYENAREIYYAGKRASDLVKQILAFSRKSEQKMTPVRIQSILKEVLKLSSSTIPANIIIHKNIQKDCGFVMADPTQIHQVAMNLITNAFHAVEEKNGIIDVELKEVNWGESEVTESILKTGQYIRLSVSDNGTGIDQNTVEHIFEPYVTTKKQGKGTGLGLAVVYGIVKEHKGEINVYSEVGMGTTFNIYLPLMPKTAETVVAEQGQKLETGTEKILLIDDEDSVTKLVGQMLSRLGYQVTLQGNSINALNLFKKDPGFFDLVISDMTMPNMTGDQLAKEVLSIKPDIPIIICTGFSERINKERAESIGVKGFLMKPVQKNDLAKMVRKILDEAKTSKF